MFQKIGAWPAFEQFDLKKTLPKDRYRAAFSLLAGIK
jgi:hypothetical protein